MIFNEPQKGCGLALEDVPRVVDEIDEQTALIASLGLEPTTLLVRVIDNCFDVQTYNRTTIHGIEYGALSCALGTVQWIMDEAVAEYERNRNFGG